jgi:hypothetical protein
MFMRTKTVAHLSLLIGLLSLNLGTACGAAPDASNPSPNFTMTTTPELEAADNRVRQAEAQLDVAKKQLSAAKSLLRAAEADVRAAKADREALALKTQAQGLAEEAGMTPSVAPPVNNAPTTRSLAAKPKVEKTSTPVTTRPVVTTQPVETTDQVVAPEAAPGAVEPAALKPEKTYDFNAPETLNAEETSAPAPQVQLR